MIISYGILGFYDSLEKRHWNKALKYVGNRDVFRIFLETNKIPAVQILVTTATNAHIQVFDINDNPIGVPISMTNNDMTTYKQLIFLGQTLAGNDDGDYYLTIQTTEAVYYSDVFGWITDIDQIDELIKINAVSSNIRLGRDYFLNLDSFEFECYVNADYLGIIPEITENVPKKDGLIQVLYGNLQMRREFEIFGTEYIHKFLLGLRILSSNGVVTITYKQIDYDAQDIIIEKLDEHYPETMQLKLSFVIINEIMSVYNELN